ncbi:MAG: SMC-Scp complex subunit ScpB [Pirellulaceae bacterium]
MNDEPTSDLESSEPPADEAVVELSLQELGRAYAQAAGLVTEEDAISEPDDEQAPPDDDTACEISPRSILEALLFVGTPDEDSPLTTRKIASWIRDVTPAEINQLAKELADEYAERSSAIRLHRDQGKLRLVLAEEFESVRDRFYGEVRHARLSQQSIDVLAIVAYNQPMVREEVNRLRGRECSAILNQLTKRQLLSAVPKPDSPRTKEYRTTDRFLELFGLETLDDLPQSEEALLPELEE